MSTDKIIDIPRNRSSSSLPELLQDSEILKSKKGFSLLNKFFHYYKELCISRESFFLSLFILMILILSAFQTVIGFKDSSIHLIADAFHGILHITAYGFSLIALIYAKKNNNINYTYGYSRIETLSAFSNCSFLYFLTMFSAFRKLHNFFEDNHEEELIEKHQTNEQIIDENSYMNFFISYKCLYNLIGMILFYKYANYKPIKSLNDVHFEENLINYTFIQNSKRIYSQFNSHFENLHTVFLHFFIDGFTNFNEFLCIKFPFLHVNYIDILCSIFILIMTFYLCKNVVNNTGKVLLQALPFKDEKSINDILQEINLIDGILNIEDKKFWGVSSENLVCSMSIRIVKNSDRKNILDNIMRILNKKFKNICIEFEN